MYENVNKVQRLRAVYLLSNTVCIVFFCKVAFEIIYYLLLFDVYEKKLCLNKTVNVNVFENIKMYRSLLICLDFLP